MDEKGLKALLLQRLYIELLLFKDSVLQKEKEDIFRDSYQIEVYINLYEIFVEYVECLGADTARWLLNLKSGILASFYRKWMDRRDGAYDELNAYVCDEMELLSEMGRMAHGDGKGDQDGTGYDQAA